MPQGLFRLTALEVQRAKTPGYVADGGNLWLQIKARAGFDGKGSPVSKSWLFRYKKEGKDRWLGLGPYPDIDLAMAREKAQAMRRLLIEGIDPGAEREQKKAQASAQRDAQAALQKTFDEATTEFIRLHAPSWRNAKHGQQWANTLRDYASPHFGKKPVGEVDTADVVRALSPIWTTKTETASRVRQRVFAVLDWAHGVGLRPRHEPGAMRAAIERTLPKAGKLIAAKKQHFKAVPYREVHDVLKAIKESDAFPLGKLGLEFLVLQAARTSEVLDARWDEFDLDAGLWTIPGYRYKTGREFTAPLSKRSIEILREAQTMRVKGSEAVFHVGNGQGFSNMVWLEQMRRLKRTETIHGFRSSFKDWAMEATNFANEVSERALGHVIENKAEAAYSRTELLEKRRALMEQWAAFLSKPAPKAATVTELAAARAAKA
jgi:integrase